MNDKFFQLPMEKQKRMINAGFKIFSESSYKKAPVSEIAEAAGISKALLFYYFKNKKELYLFLWQQTIQITKEELDKNETMQTKDFFEMLSRSLKGKCQIMREFPYLSAFSLRAYYEEEPEIRGEIGKDFQKVAEESEWRVLDQIDTSRLKKGLDIHQLYQEVIWASDGFLHMMSVAGKIEPDKMEREFETLIAFWKENYCD